jgi:hypothetical protein
MDCLFSLNRLCDAPVDVISADAEKSSSKIVSRLFLRRTRRATEMRTAPKGAVLDAEN